MFNPFNPTNCAIYGQPTTNRYRLSRELSTLMGIQGSEEFGERWEQMICQINHNAHYLFKRYGIHLNKRCRKDGTKWKAHSYHTSDMILLNDYDDIFAEKVTWRDAKRLLMDPSQNRYMPYKKTFGHDSKLFMCQAPLNTVGRIQIYKFVFDEHFTMGIYYKDDNRFEYFDSGGIGGDYPYPVCDDDGKSHLFLKPRLLGAHLKKRGVEHVYELMDCEFGKSICAHISEIFPGVEIVPLKMRDLQVHDEDIYCQSWVLLYVYLRFVGPKFSTVECLKFLETRTKKELYELVLGWWNYIIYM